MSPRHEGGQDSGRGFKTRPWPVSIAVKARYLSPRRWPAREVRWQVVDVEKDVTFSHEVLSSRAARAALVPDHADVTS